MPIFKKVNKDFFKKWSPEMAYVIGFFCADGNMITNKRGGEFWSIEIKDKKLLESIKRVVGSDHKISIRVKNPQDKGSKTYRLQIGSKDMCADLRKLGMKENKTYNLSIPKVPHQYIQDYVRGYFDGDGHVWMGATNKERKTPHVVIQTVFTSCSVEFLVSLKEILKSKDVLRGVVSKGNGNYYRLTYSINGSLKLYDFMYNGLTSRNPLFLNRKKVVFEKFIKLRL